MPTKNQFVLSPHFKIRRARPTDAEAIQRIYAPYVDYTAISFELQAPTVDEMRKRIRKTLRHYPYFVATYEGKVIAYTYAGPIGERGAYRRSAEMSIYVDSAYKRNGIGHTLYQVLEDELRRRGFCNAYAIIAIPLSKDPHLHLGSMRFHRREGYKKVAQLHRCGRKFNTWYDVMWMEKIINAHTDNPAPVATFDE